MLLVGTGVGGWSPRKPPSSPFPDPLFDSPFQFRLWAGQSTPPSSTWLGCARVSMDGHRHQMANTIVHPVIGAKTLPQYSGTRPSHPAANLSKLHCACGRSPHVPPRICPLYPDAHGGTQYLPSSYLPAVRYPASGWPVGNPCPFLPGAISRILDARRKGNSCSAGPPSLAPNIKMALRGGGRGRREHADVLAGSVYIPPSRPS